MKRRPNTARFHSTARPYVSLCAADVALCLQLGLIERAGRLSYRLTRAGLLLVGDRRPPTLLEQVRAAFDRRFSVPRDESYNGWWQK